jgi:NADPH:quinone reductase-like Zn-dependent oxidoreductase
VLLLGTGGVSIFGLQFAKMLGANAIVTSKSDEKLEKAKALGADHTINYVNDEKWDKTVTKLTGGRGVDLVVEVGGAGTLEKSLKATAYGGQVSVIGVVSGLQPKLNLRFIFMKRLRVEGIFVGHRQGFEEMNRAIAQHQLRPVIDKSFPFEKTRDALEYLEKQEHLGKVVVEF